MALVEALITLETPDGPKDGDVVAILPDGRHIPPKACRRWIRDREVPPNMPPKHRIRIQQMRFLIRSNLRQIRERLECDKPTARRMRQEALAERDLFEAEGYDLAWGYGDLREFGVVLCDLSPSEQRQLLRRERRLRYRNKLSNQTWTKWHDRQRRVDPNRTASRFRFTDFEEREGDAMAGRRRR